jgi:hypothetical protein
MPPATAAHLLDPPSRLERSDQHGGRLTLRLADEVEARMDAVGEVDVSPRRRAEERRRSRREPYVCMACGIVALVALGLDDDTAHSAVQERAADQIARDRVYGAFEEPPVEQGAWSS